MWARYSEDDGFEARFYLGFDVARPDQSHELGQDISAPDQSGALNQAKTNGPLFSGTGNTNIIAVLSGDARIDGLLWGQYWGDSTINYAFSLTGNAYDYAGTGLEDLPANFAAVSVNVEAAAHFALSANLGTAAASGFSVEGFTNVAINFLGNTDSGSAHIRFGETSSSSVGTARIGDFAGSPITNPVDDDADIWFGTAYAGGVGDLRFPTAGNYAWATNIHEIGHSLGLKHGHDSNNFAGPLPFVTDSMEYSIMTYKSYVGQAVGSGYSNGQWSYAQTFMMYDIAALQYLYGADYTSNAGNTIYSWTPDSGNTVINGSNAITPGGKKIFATIWDGGGVDTYDLSAYDSGVTVDLSPGGHSLFSGAQAANLGNGNYARGNIFNALLYQDNTASLIENAIGGEGDDKFTLNAADNNITGDLGNDTLIYGNGTENLTINLVSGQSSGTGFGNDSFSGIENIISAEGHDSITGNDQDNRLIGGGGNDTIMGGDGDDILIGGYESESATSISFGSGALIRPADAGNTSIATAIDVSGLFSLSLDADIMSSDTIPHVSISGTGDAIGGAHYYAVSLTAGDIITLDVDYASGVGGSFDAWVELYNNAGLEIAFDDDSAISDGAGGSSSGLDSYLTYNITTSGLYYFAIGRYHNLNAIPAGGTYELQLSVNSTGGGGIADSGVDVLDGGAGADKLYGGQGNDTLTGGSEDDFIHGGAGSDSLDGGADIDTLSYAGSDAAVSIVLNVSASGGHAHGDTHIGFENLIGSSHDDNLTGDNGVNVLTGGAGRDAIYAHGGADIIYGGDELGDGDYIIAGSGDDTIYGQSGHDTLYGGVGADTLYGGSGIDFLYVDNMDLVVSGGDDEDYLFVASFGAGSWAASDIENWFGASGDDSFDASGADMLVYMRGYDGNDTLSGGDAGDYLLGDNGADIISGGEGHDVLYGGAGADRLYGGSGHDVIYFDALDTEIYGNSGIDYAIAADNSGAALNLNLGAFEFAIGGAGADHLDATGASWFVEIKGGAGADYLYAGNAGSILQGGSGDDSLIAGAGNDHLVGGSGSDVFWALDNSGQDFIYDFEDGIDQVNLSQIAGVSSFADLIIDTSYQAIGWYGVDYGSGEIWLNAGAGAVIDAADFGF